ncbi:MAG: alpha/beta fold hydrolase [Anaerolineae bacterium]|jgi:carboxylesterase
MPQPENLDPGAYSADGRPVGALLIHGFGGSAAETRPMGEYLATQGLTIRCPLLAGHGTTPEDLIGIRWQVWSDEVESALQELRSRCKTVFVGGLSMGSLLALWLGANHPDIAGLLVMAPAVRVQNRLLSLTVGLRYLLKYPPPGLVEEEALGNPEAIRRIWCYDRLPLWGAAELYVLQRRVNAALPRIRQPVLIFQGRLDNWLSPRAAQIVHDGVASADKTLVWLEHSGHNVLADGERESIWAQSYDWMMKRG